MADQQIPPEELGTGQTVENVSPTDLNVQPYEPPPEDPSGSGAVPPPPMSGLPIRMIIIAGLGLLILVGIVLGIMAFLRGGSGENGGEEIALTYWGLWESKDVMQTVISDYERQHPNVHIVYEQHSPIQYRERLQAAIQRKEGPDIFRFHNTWVPMLTSDLAAVPNSVISTDQASKLFPSGVVQDLTKDDQLVGIPYGIDMLMLYYNVAMFESAGVSPPKTWEEFSTIADQLTIKNEVGQIMTAGAAMGTADNVEHFSDILGLIMFQNGVTFSNLSSPAANQALEFYSLFAMPPNNIWDANQDNSIVAFASGQVAMVFAPSWQVDIIKSINPDLNFATATVPQLAGATPVGWGTYWVEGVSSQSTHKDEAFEFVKYLSEKETMSKLYAEASKLESRSFGEPYARIDLHNQLASSEYLAPIAEQAPYMHSWYMASRTQDNGINDKIISYLKDAVNAVNQGSSSTGAWETALQGIQQVLVEYNVESK
ncbi:MAG: ABC transporter, solute-binding protein [Microgenomates group bacterium GW2011_GWC1_41_8]|uniref:ABC transporter, solute-binding protein n=3 Tax=Candidatus Roizmaniibacteriota TaxID=1752723 RepID=A0A0G0X6Y9_9BACT|nr:MAG: ABC transporter, solute-binding protein [Candidatus Levybacteria bacterium GW2011_GWA2_40_16]KKR72065.1 MAG: ABC transporter, solute-binding protein [Candidatus Roizmanbacteria bacterium GW2011_GWB1_40_7]KKR94372.1 MAG: ABC transporter, solute-binding protein [Candidatus Roizmanbacteria bacterium GW2011_GWA1_41_13]KKS20849.1 MAG: ABC transporter, solute-binding protein [Candidatus Roizmanbacteria bacterium GW2011_GWC2_41_7]KKS24445.1 MAG: ABC transporter, solute-binding protein [Microge